MAALLVLAAALPVQAKKPKVQRKMLVSTEWLAQHLGNHKLLLIQIGHDRKAYDAGHIPGAQFVAFSDIVTQENGNPNELPHDIDLVHGIRRMGIDRHKRIVIYDDMDGLLAARLWFTMDYLALGDRAALLDGGWKKWSTENRAVTTEMPPPRKATSYKPHIPNDVTITMPEAREMSRGILGGDPKHGVLIDARPEAQFRGDEPGEEIKRAGHIPGAASVYWKRALVSEENPVLKTPEELRAIFTAARLRRGVDLVTYCRTGVQASFDYFVLRYLGYQPKLYDGSFIEWSAARDTSVATGDAR